ncbi:hypothetical protein O5165_25415, partial [Escherichia coli]|nr:hypothetical protein [Escherichia coli]
MELLQNGALDMTKGSASDLLEEDKMGEQLSIPYPGSPFTGTWLSPAFVIESL